MLFNAPTCTVTAQKTFSRRLPGGLVNDGPAHLRPQITGHFHKQNGTSAVHTPPNQADISQKQDEVRSVNACMSLQTCFYAFDGAMSLIKTPGQVHSVLVYNVFSCKVRASPCFGWFEEIKNDQRMSDHAHALGAFKIFLKLHSKLL